MAPFVVVELPAAEAGSPHAAALIAACTAGLRQGRCAMAASQGVDVGSNEPAEPPATAIAIVTFGDPDRLEIRVEVGTRREGRTEWLKRDLRFQPADAENERWRSAGFAVASLAAKSDRESEPPRDDAPRAAPAVRRPPPSSGGGAAVSARVETGPGLDRGPFRVGAGLGTSYELPNTRLSLGLLGSHAIRPDAVAAVDVSWTTLAAGVGLRAGLGARFEVHAFAGPVARRIQASGTDSGTGARATADRWLPGALLEGSVRWPTSSSVGALIGASLVRLTGGTAIRVRGARAASSPALEPGLFMGLEVRP